MVGPCRDWLGGTARPAIVPVNDLGRRTVQQFPDDEACVLSTRSPGAGEGNGWPPWVPSTLHPCSTFRKSGVWRDMPPVTSVETPGKSNNELNPGP
jgi:hypothetical protein